MDVSIFSARARHSAALSPSLFLCSSTILRPRSLAPAASPLRPPQREAAHTHSTRFKALAWRMSVKTGPESSVSSQPAICSARRAGMSLSEEAIIRKPASVMPQLTKLMACNVSPQVARERFSSRTAVTRSGRPNSRRCLTAQVTHRKDQVSEPPESDGHAPSLTLYIYRCSCSWRAI